MSLDPGHRTLSQPDPRGGLRGWSFSIACSLAIHASVAGLLLAEFGKPPRPLQPTSAEAPMVVELADTVTASAAPTSEVPPGPEQQEQEAQPAVAQEAPAFDPPPEAKGPPPADALPVKVQKVPLAPAAAKVEQTTAPAAAVAEKADDKPKAPVEGASETQARAVNQSWENRLLAHLTKHKRYPSAARMLRQEDVIYLQFVIDRRGRVLTSRIMRSRGYSALDAEVASLIRRASPLPPPPDTMGGTDIQMVVPIEFYLRQAMARR